MVPLRGPHQTSRLAVRRVRQSCPEAAPRSAVRPSFTSSPVPIALVLSGPAMGARPACRARNRWSAPPDLEMRIGPDAFELQRGCCYEGGRTSFGGIVSSVTVKFPSVITDYTLALRVKIVLWSGDRARTGRSHRSRAWRRGMREARVSHVARAARALLFFSLAFYRHGITHGKPDWTIRIGSRS